jgi:hypothetical protein
MFWTGSEALDLVAYLMFGLIVGFGINTPWLRCSRKANGEEDSWYFILLYNLGMYYAEF